MPPNTTEAPACARSLRGNIPGTPGAPSPLLGAESRADRWRGHRWLSAGSAGKYVGASEVCIRPEDPGTGLNTVNLFAAH